MWKPVVSETDSLKISEKIDEIAALLSMADLEQKELSLLDGSIGTAIFIAYYGRYRKSEYHLELAGELITETIDKLNNTSSQPFTYANGIPGIFWGIQHLIQEGFIEADADELFAETDNLVCKMMIEQLKSGNFDYLHGGMGLMLYLLQRNKKEHAEQLEEALHALKNIAVLDEERRTAKWISTIYSDDTSHKVYNLSLSHGISSIINILARYLSNAKDSVNYKQHEQLFVSSINYLKEQHNSEEFSFCFPNYIFSETGQKMQGTKIAWCYGDLGMAISLWTAANFVEDPSLKQYSLHILEYFLKDNAYKLTGVMDGALCHGSAGIAHIYQRMYNYTNVEEFRALAANYYNDTLNFASSIDGPAGYKATHGLNNFKDSIGLLEGIAGIGLSLISAISDIEPKWDECLLLS